VEAEIDIEEDLLLILQDLAQDRAALALTAAEEDLPSPALDPDQDLATHLRAPEGITTETVSLRKNKDSKLK